LRASGELRIAELFATRFGGLKGLPRSLRNHLALVLSHGSQNVDGQLVRMWVIDCDKLHPRFHLARPG
jgi:hypothetical protein